jgi:hypothetical protein
LVISQVLHMLFNRWDTNYHVITWCEMQTVIWMLYSDSTHFSERFSYIKHFISNYSLKVINFARYK